MTTTAVTICAALDALLGLVACGFTRWMMKAARTTWQRILFAGFVAVVTGVVGVQFVRIIGPEERWVHTEGFRVLVACAVGAVWGVIRPRSLSAMEGPRA
jgi:hypothetical protein